MYPSEHSPPRNAREILNRRKKNSDTLQRRPEPQKMVRMEKKKKKKRTSAGRTGSLKPSDLKLKKMKHFFSYFSLLYSVNKSLCDHGAPVCPGADIKYTRYTRTSHVRTYVCITHYFYRSYNNMLCSYYNFRCVEHHSYCHCSSLNDPSPGPPD